MFLGRIHVVKPAVFPATQERQIHVSAAVAAIERLGRLRGIPRVYQVRVNSWQRHQSARKYFPPNSVREADSCAAVVRQRPDCPDEPSKNFPRTQLHAQGSEFRTQAPRETRFSDCSASALDAASIASGIGPPSHQTTQGFKGIGSSTFAFGSCWASCSANQARALGSPCVNTMLRAFV